jgi:mannose-1-phosphate guanylyltransferase/mannose-6-phosphate isomerase
MSVKITPVILCGGQGTRLWPVSRRSFPKQFVKLQAETSSFQNAVTRVRNPALFAPPLIVAAHEHRFIVQQQLDQLGAPASVLLEPLPRDSGPAMLAAALHAEAGTGPGTPLLFLAADHDIAPVTAFEESCAAGLVSALAGNIVTFGVPPSEPSTRFGYIKPGAPIAGEVLAVEAFVEKPAAAIAAGYVASGYLWNSGNFLCRGDVLIGEFAAFAPDILASVQDAVQAASRDLDFMILDRRAFEATRAQSIDYAVMEKTARAAVVPVRFAWSDLGTWDGYWQASPKTEDGNVFSNGTVTVDSTGCYTYADGALVTLVGVHGLAVVATRDAVLVADRAQSDKVKELVTRLKSRNKPEAEQHLRSYRPWGWYEVLDTGSRFQVKRIVVTPGGRLSLQKHFHRAEHWVVVRGTALVTLEGEERLLHENQSTYIPPGGIHRLENPGRIDLELIEVQTGSYLGEDDIVRLEDVYSRA